MRERGGKTYDIVFLTYISCSSSYVSDGPISCVTSSCRGEGRRHRGGEEGKGDRGGKRGTFSPILAAPVAI